MPNAESFFLLATVLPTLRTCTHPDMHTPKRATVDIGSLCKASQGLGLACLMGAKKLHFPDAVRAKRTTQRLASSASCYFPAVASTFILLLVPSMMLGHRPERAEWKDL